MKRRRRGDCALAVGFNSLVFALAAAMWFLSAPVWVYAVCAAWMAALLALVWRGDKPS
jgi:hypothetical protein